MATDLRDCVLADVLTLQRGFDLPVGDRLPGDVPVVASTGVVDFHSESKVSAPGVVIGRSGSIGGGQYLDRDFWPLNTTLWVKDFRGNDPRFCYYLLRSLDFSGFNAGSSVPTLNRNHIASVPVRIPSDVSEQRRIAHILGTLDDGLRAKGHASSGMARVRDYLIGRLAEGEWTVEQGERWLALTQSKIEPFDDKIDLNRRMNETLEAMARALFKAWFVDFEPVRAKAEGRDPGLPPHLADLFPSRLVDSSLGPIPEGWEIRPLSDLVTDHREGVNPMDTPDVEFEHFSIPAFDDGRGPRLERGAAIRSMKLIVGDDAILVSKLNPEIARVWWVDAGRGGRSVASTEFLVLRPKPGYSRAFLYCVATSSGFREQIMSLVTGTSKSHQRAGRDSVLNLPVVVSPSAVLSAFGSFARPWLARASTGAHEATELTLVRDGLLPRLLGPEGVSSVGSDPGLRRPG